MKIYTHRIYAENAPEGFRALVDRLWPRGLSREKARLDGWYKDLAPSAALRQWFNHDENKWDGFRNKYYAELQAHQQAVQDLLEDARGESALVLLYGAKDVKRNQAAVLKDFIEHLHRYEDLRPRASPVCYLDDKE